MILKVETHDGDSYELQVESYDANVLNDQINNSEINTVVIGDLVISKINIKSILPIQSAE